MAFPTNSAGFVAASSQYLSAADSASLSITGNLTLETWVKFTTVPSSGNVINLFGKWVTAGNNLSYVAQLNNTAGTLGIRFVLSSDGSAVGLATVNWTPSTGTWYHIGIVYTAASGSFELFVNGVSQGSATGSLPTSVFNSTAIFTIGEDGDLSGGQYTNGRFVSLRVWSTTRTGSQLSTNQCTTLGATANLAAEWTLDNVLTDNSGNSNTLTDHNTVTFTTDIPATCAVSGPANLKSYNTNLKANIKSMNTNLIANVKSFDTNV